MKSIFSSYKKSPIIKFLLANQQHAPILVFMGGFIFDSLTLGRIDRTYDTVVLCLHMSFLSLCIYLYHIAEDDTWMSRFINPVSKYLQLAIQFSFGALSSAYVIYFFRSVSLSRTLVFFILLVLLFIASELFKKKISNKYLQLSIYYFISFTFFTFMLPMFLKEMNNLIFIISGCLSLVTVFGLIIVLFRSSPTTRAELSLTKLSGLIISIYISINLCYYFSLIPPVPLAMQAGLVAHEVQKENGRYKVTYEKEDWYDFWRSNHSEFQHQEKESVYVFTSIFAPTDLKKSVFHRWQWYNPETQAWEIVEDIGFEITGGRDRGFRGYTYKSNYWDGLWKVEVLTEEELLIGVVDFEIIEHQSTQERDLVEKVF